VKAAGGASANALKWGLPYLADFVRENKLYLVGALLVVLRPRTAWSRGASSGQVRPAFLWSYVALLVLPFLGYVVLVGGDFMTLGRFFVPVLPLLALLAQEALRELLERPRRDRTAVSGAALTAAPPGGVNPPGPPGDRQPDAWRPARFAGVALFACGFLVWNSLGLYRENQKLSYRRWGLDTIAYLDRFAADRILIGNWMRRHLPADTYLAVGGAGALVYASRLKALDTFGLNDAFIAHHTPPVGDRPGHTKSAPDDYLQRRRPDLMCHIGHHQDVPYRPDPFEEQHWRRRGYGWVCIDPPGLHPAYYCCLKRLDRELGPFPAEVGS